MTAETAGPRIVPANSPARPLVAAVPHAGRRVPAEFGATLTVPTEPLSSDWYTDELWDFLPGHGVTTVATTLSRFVADPNRDPASGQGGFWRSVVPVTDPEGSPVHARPLTEDEVWASVAAAHAPFHRMLDQELDSALRSHGHAVLLDLHSFGVTLGADVIIGDGNGTTARPETVAAVVDAFTRAGFTTAVNLRFSGGWTVRHLAPRTDINAVQVEINQRVYLDPAEIDAWLRPPGLPAAAMTRARARLETVIEQLVNTLVRPRPAGRVTPARPPAIEVTQEPIGPEEGTS